MKRLTESLFALYEKPRLRNWAYSIAFAVVVPIGGRFAYLAGHQGGAIDWALAIVGGLIMIALAIVTLIRFWSVQPVSTQSGAIQVRQIDKYPRSGDRTADGRFVYCGAMGWRPRRRSHRLF